MRAAAPLAAALLAAGPVAADLPVHCLVSQVLGDWELLLGDPRTAAPRTMSMNCDGLLTNVPLPALKVTLSAPNVAKAGDAVGTFTMIADQGVEITVRGKVFFWAFDYAEGHGGNVTSQCHRVRAGMGFYHEEASHAPRTWGCLGGAMVKTAVPGQDTTFTRRTVVDGRRLTARQVPPEVVARRARALPTRDASFRAAYPKAWDWRDVGGEDYVGPIRDQLLCGSCYAFGTIGMLESRTRVATNNTVQRYLSPQDVVSCSRYSQGCDGGFAYQVTKYASEFGIVELGCMAYQQATDVPCDLRCRDPSQRHYFTGSYYVGGYFNRITDPSVQAEELIMADIYKHGPLAVGVQATDAFDAYLGSAATGVYTQPPTTEGGLVATNHEVMLVGWGEEADGTPYWILRNSWGRHWGGDAKGGNAGGYMKIRRGHDDAGIESCPVGAHPVRDW